MKKINQQLVNKKFRTADKFEAGKSGVYYTISGRLMKDGKDVYIAIPSNGNMEKAVTNELCVLHNMKNKFFCKSIYMTLIKDCVSWFWSRNFILDQRYFADKAWYRGLKPDYGFIITKNIYDEFWKIYHGFDIRMENKHLKQNKK